jgi:hypothetical protein
LPLSSRMQTPGGSTSRSGSNSSSMYGYNPCHTTCMWVANCQLLCVS